MGTYVIKLPDIGEGIAEAELSNWHVKVGDTVQEDDILAAVMTDKAAVEVPTPRDGVITELHGNVGDLIPIGSILITLEVSGEGNTSSSLHAPEAVAAPVDKPPQEVQDTPQPSAQPEQTAQDDLQTRDVANKPLAAPSVRARARSEGIDLRHVHGTGPAGRISHDDIDRFLSAGGIAQGAVKRGRNTGIEDIRVTGMRRKIAQKMSVASSRIPHITIVEEVELDALQDLRSALNSKYEGKRTKLSLLPFIIRAIVEAVREQPVLNARYDDEADIIHCHGGVHVGIATQTPNGLNVPVVKHAEARSLWDNALEILRLAEAARSGSVKLDELQGGTITITSLGPLGAIATTPIINHPEVAIVGVNKMQIRPVWDGQEFRPRRMMNLSCSFDHRVVDGWDAAVFVRKLKDLLETPAMLFVEG